MSPDDPMNAKPASERCTARSKRTGRRCGQLVPGGGVCGWHGGKAPQVARQREARLVVAEARAAAGRNANTSEARDPAHVLLAAVNDTAAVLDAVKAKMAGADELRPADLVALAEWLDRSARIAKAALDVGLKERVEQLNQELGIWLLDRMEALATALGYEARAADTMAVIVHVLEHGTVPPTVVEVEPR